MNPRATVPSKMRAWALTGTGSQDRLEFRTDWPTPTPGADEVLVRVQACGLNNTDVNVRRGWYSRGEPQPVAWDGSELEFPRVQGADVAGTVLEVGRRVENLRPGQRVLIDPWLRDRDDPHNRGKCRYLGSECDGGFADCVVADGRNVHAIESDLSAKELATFATSYGTAENMLDHARVTGADTVLITGASGGVGSALIQLARRRKARIVALCGADKRDQVAAIGAHAVLPRDPGDLGRALRESMGSERVDVVADVVGGPGWPRLIRSLARGGRYTCAGAIAGPRVELDLRNLYLHDLTFTGATVTPPGLFARLVCYIEAGEIRPLLAASYPLEQLREAQRAFIEKRHVGNIVVTTKSDT